MSQTLTVRLLIDIIDGLLLESGAVGRGQIRELRDYMLRLEELNRNSPPALSGTQAQIPASPVAEGRKNGASPQ